jgi:hypothetical protein
LLPIISVLVGCAAGEHTRVMSRVFGDDGTAPALMTNQHIVAWVSFGERHRNHVTGIERTALYQVGVRSGSPNLRYRYVTVGTPRLEHGKALLFWDNSAQLYLTGAMIPDQIGKLEAGDVVELRSIASWDTNVNFHADEEGQIITKVLCRMKMPDRQACLDALPRFGKHPVSGQTGTPYPRSVKGYEGFTFSTYYDDEGQLTRPLPRP